MEIRKWIHEFFRDIIRENWKFAINFDNVIAIDLCTVILFYENIAIQAIIRI